MPISSGSAAFVQRSVWCSDTMRFGVNLVAVTASHVQRINVNHILLIRTGKEKKSVRRTSWECHSAQDWHGWTKLNHMHNTDTAWVADEPERF